MGKVNNTISFVVEKVGTSFAKEYGLAIAFRVCCYENEDGTKSNIEKQLGRKSIIYMLIRNVIMFNCMKVENVCLRSQGVCYDMTYTLLGRKQKKWRLCLVTLELEKKRICLLLEK